MPDEGRRRGVDRLRTGRCEALNHRAFAIAITLLVLDLGLPSDLGVHVLRSPAAGYGYLAMAVVMIVSRSPSRHGSAWPVESR